MLATVYSKPPRLMLYPTGTGAERRIDTGQLEAISGAAWFPDDPSVLVCGNEAGHATRCYVQALAGGPPRPVTPEGTTIPLEEGSMVSPDARSVIVRDLTKSYRRYSLVGDSARAIPGLTPNDQIVRWSPDGRALWVRRRSGEVPVRVERLDLVTGRREPLIEVGRRDQPGIIAIFGIAVADDPKVYAYAASQYVSHLFVVDGVR